MQEGDLGERAMRSVIAAADSLFCAKDDEESRQRNRSHDENPETTYGQRLGDIANILMPKVIDLLTQDQHERFSRHRIIRTPETKVCETFCGFAYSIALPHGTHPVPADAGRYCVVDNKTAVARRQPHRALPGMLFQREGDDNG